MSISERDAALLEIIGMSEDQVARDAANAEDETVDDPMTGRVWYGLHLARTDEEMVSVSLRLPKSDLDRITANAKRYHLSRSEYMRRRLASA